MNCPQCQEQLDERLDEIRPALRSGTLSPIAARAQAQTALDEVASQCSECESELRAHLQLRLSLMLPDGEAEAVTVPPALRVNVRRALERESMSRSYSALNPFKGFVWTGGAVVSAIALFVIARPFLIESAQAPLPSSSSAISVVPPLPESRAPKNSDHPSPAKNGASSQPPKGVTSVPPKVRGAAIPTPVPAPRKTIVEIPSVAGVPPVVAPLHVSPPPRMRSFLHRAPAGGTAPETQPATEQQAKPRMAPKVVAPSPKSPLPMVGSSAPSFESSGKNGSGPDEPNEPRIDAAQLAPTGKALGLTVRFVPTPPSMADSVNSSSRTFSNASNSVGSSPVAPPAPLVKAAPPEDAVAQPAMPNAPQRPRAMMRAPNPKPADAVPAGGASQSPQNESSASSASTSGNLSVSVKEAVTNARVVGKVQGREGEAVLLWSGDAPAHKAISVPLAPLEAKQGDTVDVSLQQQVSLGQTKTLATASVVVP